MVVEILLGVGGFDSDGGAELTVVSAVINVQKSDVGGKCCPVSPIIFIYHMHFQVFLITLHEVWLM